MGVLTCKSVNRLLSAYKGLKHNFLASSLFSFNSCLLSAYKGLKLPVSVEGGKAKPGLLSAYKGLKP